MVAMRGSFGHCSTANLGPTLHTAAQASLVNEEIIRLLLDAKADVHIKGGRYHTALQATSLASNKHVFARLLEMGAEINAKEESTVTHFKQLLHKVIEK